MSISSCIFCKILRGEAPASFVHRNEQVSAFMDIRPVTMGHVLVVPNEHAARLADLDPGTGGRLFALGQAVAAALHASGRSEEGGIRCEGVNFHLADGEAAGQEVDHVHLHIFPRFAGDGFGLRLPPGYPRLPPRTSLDATAQALQKALD